MLREGLLFSAAAELFGSANRVECDMPQCTLRVARFNGFDRMKKIAKTVFLLAVLGYGANVLADKLVCGVVTDENTGVQVKICAYIPDDNEFMRKALFISIINHMHRPETGFGTWYPPFETHVAANCEDARTLVENMQYGRFALGQGCMTDAEIESLRQAIFDKLTQIESDLCASYKEGNRGYKYLKLGAQIVSGVACAVPGALWGTVGGNPFGGTLLGVAGAAACGGITGIELEALLKKRCK